MNAKDLTPIHKELLPSLPGFASRKRLLLMTPMQGMLKAMHFDPSAFSKDDFYLGTFIMPLCVPKEHIVLTLGDRIACPGERKGWTLKQPRLVDDLLGAIQTDGLPFLNSVCSADDFAEMAKRYWGNPHTPKSVAFVLARDGQYDRAIAVIDALLPTLNLEVTWERGIFDDATNLRRLVLSDPNEAQRKLAEWEEYTIGKLKLEAFR